MENLKKALSTGEIRDYDSIESYTEDLKAQGVKYSKLVPTNYICDTDMDIFTIEGDIIVNEYVKKAIESSLPNQVQFDSVQLLNISISQSKYDSKSSQRITIERLKDSDSSMDEELVFYYQKAKESNKKIRKLSF